MQSIPPTSRECFICASSEQEVIEDFLGAALFVMDDFYSIDIKKVLCKQCGLIYASHYLGVEHLERLYVSMNAGPENLTYRFSAAPDYNQFFVDSLTKMFPNRRRRVLDVGCGRCQTLDRFKSLGWETYGVDISPLSQDLAKKKGHSVWCGAFQDIDFGDIQFEAILFEESLEHMLNPNFVLERVNELLTDSGLIGVSLPESYTCLKSKNLYDILRDDHCNHFTPVTIRKLLTSKGLYPLDMYLDVDAPLPDMKVIASKKPVFSLLVEGFEEKRDFSREAMQLYWKMKQGLRDVFSKETSGYKRIVVYCAGSYATIVLPVIWGDYSKRVTAFIDNDLRKYGKSLYNKPVLPSRDLKDLNPDCIVIASEQFENEICGNISEDMQSVKIIKAHHFLKDVLSQMVI